MTVNVSGTAFLFHLSTDRYQDWLREQDNKDRQTAMKSELDTKLATRPSQRSPADFYRPMSEKMIDNKMQQQPAYRPPATDPVSNDPDARSRE